MIEKTIHLEPYHKAFVDVIEGVAKGELEYKTLLNGSPEDMARYLRGRKIVGFIQET